VRGRGSECEDRDNGGMKCLWAEGWGKGCLRAYMWETLDDVRGQYNQQEWRKISTGGRMRGTSHWEGQRGEGYPQPEFERDVGDVPLRETMRWSLGGMLSLGQVPGFI
jgi:hypothetical protein